MDYPKPIIKACSGNKTDVARFVSDLLESSPKDSAWIMIMSRGKSEGYFVCTATSISLDDTDEIALPGISGQVYTCKAEPDYSSQNSPNVNEERKEN